MEEFFITLTLENSAEACSWNNYLKHKNSEEVLRAPMCAMTAGYISGWSTCVFDTPLATVEVKCHANHNNTSCVFLVAPPDKIEEHVRTYLDEAGRLQVGVDNSMKFLRNI
jgi:predicted hydrocarbon binding protein